MENNHCILAVTADLMRCPQQECLAAGANEYMIKPIDFKVLTSKLPLLLQNVF